ncbi:MAG: PadR family transcriptional regulator [Syntrophaceticus sp.]|nr:PadR family transcriptional regulator [Syntrophaceticus sp.]MDD3315797.1 PadR family transcriptional regulator [Syntrophaceticus sp.]MDD4360791.1 PadR family transcriptional regulator [Syntrophaceticus sp.]MDD4782387.1 PadR family transcriptional regulator [Syntrophaceticus sp.]
MKNTQLLKGLLEGCVLKLIGDGETYGYEIVETLKEYGFQEISEGTVYPLLIRLKKNKMLYSKDRASPYGPKRKYYSLTQEGEKEVENFYRTWLELRDVIDMVFNDYKGGEIDE